MNIVDPILFQCKYNPLAAAISAPGQNMGLISYGRLETSINNVGRRAVALGLRRGHIVGILVEDRILNAAICLSLAALGVATFQSRGFDPPAELQVEAVLTDRQIPPSRLGKQIIFVDRDWLEGDGRLLDDPRRYEVGPDDLCRIVLTSGSTGEPKAVGLTHAMLARRLARHDYMMGNQLASCSRIYNDFPFAASLGFQFLIYALWKGGTIFCGGGEVDATIQTFDLYKVQALVGSPVSLAGFTKFYEMNPRAQSRFEVAIVGGSQLHRSLSERARARLCSNVVSCYGTTETSMIASAPAHAIVDVPGAVGHIIPGVSVEIVDENERPVRAGAEGMLRIRGPYNVPAYMGGAARSASLFRGGFFYPGDIGRMTADGLLVIGGRKEAILNVAGDKLKPEAVEAVIAAFPAVEDAAVVTVKNEFGIDQIVSLIVPRGAVDESALRSYCATRLPPGFVPLRFQSVKALPRNEAGKLARDRLDDLMIHISDRE